MIQAAQIDTASEVSKGNSEVLELSHTELEVIAGGAATVNVV